MARGKSEPEIRQIAMNICQEKGIDMNQAYENFKQQFKGFIPFK